MTSYTLVIALVFFIAVSNISTAYDTASCCRKPDIQLTVDCTTTPGLIQLQWHSEVTSLWGFCVSYDCKLPTDGDYCNSYENQKCYNYFDKSQSHSETREELGIPDNESCWFWVKNHDFYNIDDDGRGCSELVCCNISLSSVNSSTQATSTVDLPQASSVDLDPTSPVSPSATSSKALHGITTVHLPPSSSSPLTSLVSLTPPILLSVEFSSVYSIISLVTEVANTTEETISLTTTSPPSQTSQTIITQDKTFIAFYVTLCCSIIFITLVLIISLFVYWHKSKQKYLKFSAKKPVEHSAKGTDELDNNDKKQTMIN